MLLPLTPPLFDHSAGQTQKPIYMRVKVQVRNIPVHRFLSFDWIKGHSTLLEVDIFFKVNLQQ